jgi:hypothetical protein
MSHKLRQHFPSGRMEMRRSRGANRCINDILYRFCCGAGLDDSETILNALLHSFKFVTTFTYSAGLVRLIFTRNIACKSTASQHQISDRQSDHHRIECLQSTCCLFDCYSVESAQYSRQEKGSAQHIGRSQAVLASPLPNMTDCQEVMCLAAIAH